MTQASQIEIGGDLVLALQEAQKGDQSAWETLFKECYPKVRRVVRRRLNRSMRSLYDSTDFASDVMGNLVANLDRLKFPSVDSLLAFLAQVAEQKVIDEHRPVSTHVTFECVLPPILVYHLLFCDLCQKGNQRTDGRKFELIEVGSEVLHRVVGEICRVVQRSHRSIQPSSDNSPYLGIARLEQRLPGGLIPFLSLLQSQYEISPDLQLRHLRHDLLLPNDVSTRVAARSNYLKCHCEPPAHCVNASGIVASSTGAK